MWRANNTFNCSWNAMKQAFEGDGCVVSDKTYCMCRHLTDFVAVRKPNIAVASMDQMTSLSMDDIVNKLRFLFIVVVGLFGLMNVGAFFAALEERLTKKRLLKLIK